MNLLRYIFKRLMLAVVSVLVLATLTFIITRAAPGDPLVTTKEIPVEVRKNLEEKYGLNKPMVVQYGIQMYRMFIQFDFGESFRQKGRSVNEMIRDTFPVSAKIGLISVAIGWLLGLFLGIFAAFKRNTIFDREVMLLCVCGTALPGFLFAYLFQYCIAVYPVKQGWIDAEHGIPTAGWGTYAHYFLPLLSLAIGSIAGVTRMMRSQMVDVQFSDYVKTAKSKGVSSARLIFVHELRNAILPLVTIAGPMIVWSMMGAILVEMIYGVPGIGKSFMEAITNRDYNVILGLTVFEGGFLILATLGTDILYGLVDPRIRVTK